jgi:hypothetical protein
LKGNQPQLHEAVSAVFDRACEAEFDEVEYDGNESAEDGRGRHKERHVTVICDPEGLPRSVAGRGGRRWCWSGGR